MKTWIIVYLGRDPFAVNRAEYLEVVAQAKGDWIQVSEWVETNGTFVGRKLCPVLQFQHD